MYNGTRDSALFHKQLENCTSEVEEEERRPEEGIAERMVIKIVNKPCLAIAKNLLIIVVY
jgi:hypothetical protein